MINPKAALLFGLQPQKVPRVRVEAGHVIVRLELVSLRDQTDALEIELALPPEIAGPLGLDLVDATQRLGEKK
jgi:hypothetical protein